MADNKNTSDKPLGDNRKYKIQLRYKDGKVLDFITSNPPVHDFTLPYQDREAHFEVFLTLIKCGDNITIQKVFYKEIN